MTAEAIGNIDHELMRRAIDLARLGAGRVSPNPMVGAVLVQGGEIVGEGFHLYDQVSHAESNALQAAGARAHGATLYCSLEPCAHFGRTPPCTDALIAAGIARAFIATVDPDPRVSGKGIAQLRAAGVQVDVGLCEAEARRVNEAYFKFISTRTPFIHLVTDRRAANAGPWLPSPAWLDAASASDAIWLGPDAEINRLAVDFALGFSRHRPLIVIGTRAGISGARAEDRAGGSFTPLVIEREAQPGDASLATRLEISAVSLSVVTEEMARQRALSLMILPQADPELAAFLAERADRVTLVVSEEASGDDELAEATMQPAGEAWEITGYPRQRHAG